MNTTLHKTATTLLASLALVAFAAASAAASEPKALLIAPGEPYGLPKFGFSGANIHGVGERVVYVRYGGRAARLGLEPGDIILSLNGFPLTYRGSWNDALSHAVYEDGGVVRLRIHDVRTGRVIRRETFVGGYGDGPVAHYNVGGHFRTPWHVEHHDHHVATPHTYGPTLKITEIAKLFDKD